MKKGLFEFSSWPLLRLVLKSFSECVDFIYKIEAHPMLWVGAFLSITFLRDFLENFIEYPVRLISLGHHFEFSLFWIALFFCMTIWLCIMSGEAISKVSKLVVFGWLVTFIAPIFDLFYYRGHTFEMGYVFKDLLHNYLTFYSGCPYSTGATMGIRVEIVLVSIFSAIFVARQTRNWLRALLAGVGAYTIVFIFMAMPAIYWQVSLSFFHVGILLEYPDCFSMVFLIVTGVMIPIYFGILGVKQMRVWPIFNLGGFKVRLSVLLVLVKNCRPERVIHYSVLVLIGVFLGVRYVSGDFTLIHVLHVGFLIGSVVFAWLFAVGVNDIFDRKIDEVSNPDRPLIEGTISVRDYKIYTAGFALVSLLLASAVSFWSASIIFYYMVAYSFIYSAPPLRLRQYLVLPNILIGLCSLLSVLLGFSVLGGIKTFALIPKDIALFIFLAFTFASTVKDLKDYEGDRVAGVVTLPTLLGLSVARLLIAFLVAVMFAMSTLFVASPGFWIWSSLFSVVSFYIVLKKTEKYVFGLWFIFAVIFAVNL